MMSSRPVLGFSPHARHFAVCGLVAGLLASSFAQDGCTFVGDDSKLDFENSGNRFQMLVFDSMWTCDEGVFTTSLPLGIATQGLSNPGAITSVTAELRQTKYENPLEPFSLVPLGSSRVVASRAIGNMYAANEYTLDVWLGIYQEFMAWVEDKIADELTPPPLGEFELRIYWDNKGWNAYEARHVFWWFQNMHDNEDFPGGSLGDGSGGLTVADLDAQNVNQEGFWASLFVPDPENIDLLKEKAMDLMNWGPFGLIAALNGKIQAYDASVSEVEGVMSLPTPFGNIDADFRPYGAGIKMVRWLMAGLMWWSFIWLLWRHIYAKV